MRAGQQFAGRYRIESRLGEGGSGSVWRAQDELFGGVVALKVASAGDRSALRAELEVLADAFHPRLARVLDLGVASDGDSIVSYHASELVDGEPLGGAQRSFAELAPAIADVLDAIRFLHSNGSADCRRAERGRPDQPDYCETATAQEQWHAAVESP